MQRWLEECCSRRSLFAAMAAVLCLGERIAAGTGEVDALRAVREGYLHNRESFRSFVCRFKIHNGQAESLDAARAGRLTALRSRTGVWLMTPGRVRYELRCTDRNNELDAPTGKAAPRAKTAAQDETFTSLPCQPEVHLSDAHSYALYSPLLNVVNLKSGVPVGKGVVVTPLSMGVMGEFEEFNPASMIQDALDGRAQYSYETFKDDQGRAIDRVKIIVASGPEPKITTWDLARAYGFLPMKVNAYRGDRHRYTTEVTDVRQATNGSFFPARVVDITAPGKNPPYSVQIIDSVSFDVENSPVAEDFGIALPRGTTVVDTANLRSSFKVTDTTEVRLDDLPSLFTRTAKALADRDLPTPTGTRDTTGVQIVLALACIVAAIALITLRYRRSKKAHERTLADGR
jgi:hypothetical protein